MEVKLYVDNDKCKKIIENELSALSKEELHNIVVDLIKESFKSVPLKDMLFVERDGIYGSDRVLPGPILKEAIKNINFDNELKDFKDKLISELKENHKEIIEKMMLNCLINNFMSNSSFMNSLQCAVRDVMDELNSKNRN